ncbi:MAG: DUF1987 domain-containing protein [Bacteroidia bacterium]
MEPLIIKGAGENPEVDFDGNSGLFKISGKSYPENVNEFYKPLLDYFELYKKEPKEKTILEFSWIYFNTATSKIIIKLILSLKALKDINKYVEIRWYCKRGDELMIEKGEEMRDVLDMNFEIIFR